MRQIWIREVRYYKYVILLCIFLSISGLMLLNEYNKQENNIGTVINVVFIKNVSYVIPVYKVRHQKYIYNVYDNCVISNLSKCSNNINIENIINMNVYFEQLNGFYIILQRNHFPLYFAAFAFTFSGLLTMIIMYAYYDYSRLRKNEYNAWSKQKKYDADIETGEYTSFIYF